MSDTFEEGFDGGSSVEDSTSEESVVGLAEPIAGEDNSLNTMEWMCTVAVITVSVVSVITLIILCVILVNCKLE